MTHHAAILGTRRRDTEWFIDQLRGVSPGNLRALWLPHPVDTTTNILKPDGRVWTNSATIQSRITYQGGGILVSFNGTDQYATTPDADDLSFGDGTTDSPFSVVAQANVTDTAAQRSLLIKRGSGTYEYGFLIGGTDLLTLVLADQSASVFPSRGSNAAITMGAIGLFGASYDGSGGATAANGITLYENGVVKASTATNNASYVAMENLDGLLTLGNDITGASRLMQGSMGFAAIYAANLTASQHAQIASIVREYFKVALA